MRDRLRFLPVAAAVTRIWANRLQWKASLA